MTDMQHRLFVDAGGGEGGALAGLGALDPDSARALTKYGPPPDRSLPAGFETLARAIVGQQVSRAAASAIWQKMEARGVTGIDAVAGASIEQMMTAGLSRRKAEYLIGIADEIAGKTRKVRGPPSGEPVAAVVARGEAEIGFQQVAEMIHVPGIDFVGTVPSEIQPPTLYVGAVPTNSQQPDAAMALLHFLSSADAAAVITKDGLKPLPPH